MIVLDTNVVSALMRHDQAVPVVDWLDDQPTDSVWTTSVTLFEIRFGLELLPSGRRRHALEAAFREVIADDLQDRVLSFDAAAGEAAAAMAATAQRTGHNIDIRDIQIAGIVASRRATLATRNARDFAPLGLTLVDPWA